MNYFSPYHRYLFELIAIKNRSNDETQLRSTAIVQINLINDNANKPECRSNNNIFYISEAALPGTSFGTVYALDPDGDSVTYTSNSSQFSIDPVTGVLKLRREFPRYCNFPCTYFVNITVTDDGSSCALLSSCAQKSCSMIVEIKVLSENRHSPEFLNPTCNGMPIRLYESTAANTIVASLLVVDNDRDKNGLIDVIFPPENLRATGK